MPTEGEALLTWMRRNETSWRAADLRARRSDRRCRRSTRRRCFARRHARTDRRGRSRRLLATLAVGTQLTISTPPAFSACDDRALCRRARSRVRRLRTARALRVPAGRTRRSCAEQRSSSRPRRHRYKAAGTRAPEAAASTVRSASRRASGRLPRGCASASRSARTCPTLPRSRSSGRDSCDGRNRVRGRARCARSMSAPARKCVACSRSYASCLAARRAVRAGARPLATCYEPAARMADDSRLPICCHSAKLWSWSNRRAVPPSRSASTRRCIAR